MIDDHQPEKLTEGQIRKILLDHVESKFNYSQRPLSQMVLGSVRYFNEYIYELKTLTELRTSSRACKPCTKKHHRSRTLDEVSCGPLDIWAIQVNPPGNFVDFTTPWMLLPHTEQVKPCNGCGGDGDLWDGEDHLNKVPCLLCNTSGCLIWYQQFKCDFKVDVQQFVTGKLESVNSRDFINSGSVELFNEITKRTLGLSAGQFFNRKIVEFSQVAVDKKFGLANIRRQQQTVKAIPVVEVSYNLDNKSGSFFIFGTKRQVCFPKYPGAYCCIS